MSDLISRQAVLDALTALEEPAPTAQHLSAIYDCEDAIKALPSIQPTLYGYNVNHLSLIANVMKKEGVTPEKAVQIFCDIQHIVEMLRDEMTETAKKALKGMLDD